MVVTDDAVASARERRMRRARGHGGRRALPAARLRPWRVAAIPVLGEHCSDLIVRDRSGRCWLLERDGSTPVPLCRAELDALGMFFEPSVDLSWHTEAEVRAMLGCRSPVTNGTA